MQITWLGHASFRIEIAGRILLIDPWFEGNPSFPPELEETALAGAEAIFLTHGHRDHAGDVLRLHEKTAAPIYTMTELATILSGFGAKATGYSIGGTITLGEVEVTMVPASHSSSFKDPNGVTHYAGLAAGFMIKGEGRVIYLSGDTGLMADMAWMAEVYRPDIGILCAGGHFTMDMAQAGYAATRYFNFRDVIPCHFKTFPALAQSTEALAAALPETVTLHLPEVGAALTL